MKSIKEQQTEYVLAHTELVESYEAYAEKEEIAAAYETGANYVLEEIESLIKDVSDEYPRFQQGAIIHGRIIKLLEQLKK